MDNYSLINKLKEVGICVPVKIQINNSLYDIEDIIWTGLDNEGCYKIVIKK